jgi:hypothetical protein
MVQPPIIVDARSELLLFRSVELAEAWLEAIDVRNGEYAAAYDSEGRRLEVGTKIVTRRVLLVPTKVELASLTATDDQVSHVPELRELLKTHLLKDQVDAASQGSVGSLVALAVERQGFTA